LLLHTAKLFFKYVLCTISKFNATVQLSTFNPALRRVDKDRTIVPNLSAALPGVSQRKQHRPPL
jgi:hypothetical protein